jgi:hypothetical protein
VECRGARLETIFPRRGSASEELGKARKNEAAARAVIMTGAFRTFGIIEDGVKAVKEKRPAESISYADTAYRSGVQIGRACRGEPERSPASGSLEVGVVTGVDLDHSPRLDELRNHHGKPGFECRRFV